MKPFLSVALAASLTLGLVGSALAQLHGGPPGNHPDWHKGGRIAQSDWSRGSTVDWRARHLRRPPHGYQWREVDGNYVLAAVATGVIASLILNAH